VSQSFSPSSISLKWVSNPLKYISKPSCLLYPDLAIICLVPKKSKTLKLKNFNFFISSPNIEIRRSSDFGP
jgi:hypothetical protein